MKKFLPFILILIVLTGLFSPVSRVQAEGPEGDCVFRVYSPIRTTSETTRETEENCHLNHGSDFISWHSATQDAQQAAIRAKCQEFYGAFNELALNKCIQDFTLTGRHDHGGTIVNLSDFYTPSTVNPDGTPAGSGTNPDGTSAGGETPKDTSALFGQCWGANNLTGFSPGGCLASFGYWLLITIPSGILYYTAYMFNSMLALTLGTVLYKNNFLPEAWRIVRDFSNIFFILVLLYISIKMILGLGGAEIKKMVVGVIVAALLINFSMFMTKVVIDASNILALIFYNKISVTGAPYDPVVGSKNGVTDKDIATGIATGFNPTKFINPASVAILNREISQNYKKLTYEECVKQKSDFYGNFPTIGTITIGCYIDSALAKEGVGTTLPLSIALMVEVVAAAIFLFASYAFFIAGLAFIGRLIELWILIIFSPFAFMSLSIPDLQKTKYLGWDDWSKRLISVAFMAPIFMFFLLLITKLIQIDIFKDVLTSESGSISRVLLILAIPAIIYLTMLYKATEYAKKGAGEFGEAVIKYGKAATVAVGGLALGAATGGAGLALSGTLGRAGAAVNKSGFLKDAESKGGPLGFAAARLRDIGGFTGKSSFDLRKAPGIGSALKAAGVKTESSALTKSLGLGTEGGWDKRRKDIVEKRQKRAKDLEVGEDEELKQKLNNSEQNLQEMLNKVTKDFEVIDKTLEDARQAKADATVGSPEELRAIARIDHFKAVKRNIREGGAFTADDGTYYGSGLKVNGKTIKDLQADIIPGQKNDILTETRTRKTNYAKSLTKKRRVSRTLGLLAGYGAAGLPGAAGVGVYQAATGNAKAERQAAHSIIMEVKLPDSVAK